MIYMTAYYRNKAFTVILSVAEAKRRIHFVLRDKAALPALLDPSALPQDDEKFGRTYE